MAEDGEAERVVRREGAHGVEPRDPRKHEDSAGAVLLGKSSHGEELVDGSAEGGRVEGGSPGLVVVVFLLGLDRCPLSTRYDPRQEI